MFYYCDDFELVEAYEAWIECYPFTIDDLDGELWRPLYAHAKYYASTFGRVKSFKRGEPRIIKPTLHRRGYLCVRLSVGGSYRIFGVGRLVAELFVPNPDNREQVVHFDGDIFNNHVENLRWVNRLKQPRPTRNHPWVYLTPAQVVYINDNRDQLTAKQIADALGLEESYIARILKET